MTEFRKPTVEEAANSIDLAIRRDEKIRQYNWFKEQHGEEFAQLIKLTLIKRKEKKKK